MQTLAQKALLHFIEEHTSSYDDLWKLLFSSKHTFDLHILQEYFTTQYQLRGIALRVLDADTRLFYAEMTSHSPHTLLLYFHLAPDAPLSFFPLLASLLAIDAYQATVGPVPTTIKWLVNTAPTSPNLSDQTLLQVDGCIYYAHSIDDTSTQMALGTKGYLSVELAIQTTHASLPSSYGTIAPNAAWRLLWALNTLKDAREEVLIEGFYDTLEPFEDEAIDLLRTLPDTAAALAEQWQAPQLLMGLSGMQQHYTHLLTPTCSINTIKVSSLSAPQSPHPFAQEMQRIPFQATAQIDFYLVPGQNPQAIFASLQRHLHQQGFPDVQIRLLSAHLPTYTPIDQPFVSLLRQATSAAYELPPRLLPILPITLSTNPFQQSAHPPFVIMLQHFEQTQSQNQAEHIRTNIGYSKQLVSLLDTYATRSVSNTTPL